MSRSAPDALADTAPRQRSQPLRVAARSFQMFEATILAAGVFAETAWLLWGRQDYLRTALGRALVSLCTRLGATFIKVGQIASTRGDLLPAALIAELATLQDRVPPFPSHQVREVIESSLAKPLDQLFASIDLEPIAAASVAQVHRAVLPSGEVVAVKVRRPEVLDRIALDRSILLFVARTLERLVPSIRMISFEDAMRHFCAAVEEQSHLDNELANNLRFTAAFADDPDVDFPRVYPELSSDAVLTMEFIEGLREHEIERHGIDPRRIAESGMRCVCRMIFRDGFVHADLHPGNMRFFPPGRVVLLDLGLVGEVNDRDRLSAVQLFYALAVGDGVTVARSLYDNAPFRGTLDYPTYEREIVEAVAALQQIGLGNIEITVEIGRIFDILRRHRIRARSHMTMVNLALMTVEGLGKRLVPDLSMTDAALPYLAEALGLPLPARPSGDGRVATADLPSPVHC
ncbi:MAG TPA: AarF/UbiB family protein [Terriglobales bacterium]|nr:AarF/UbiB family protein [Terriglobales bacterium]